MANGNGKKNSGDAAAASGTIDPGGQGFKKYPNQANTASAPPPPPLGAPPPSPAGAASPRAPAAATTQAIVVPTRSMRPVLVGAGALAVSGAVVYALHRLRQRSLAAADGAASLPPQANGTPPAPSGGATPGPPAPQGSPAPPSPPANNGAPVVDASYWGTTSRGEQYRALFTKIEEVTGMPLRLYLCVVANREAEWSRTARNKSKVEVAASQRGIKNGLDRGNPLPKFSASLAEAGSGGLFGALAPYVAWTGFDEDFMPYLDEDWKVIEDPIVSAIFAAKYYQRIVGGGRYPVFANSAAPAPEDNYRVRLGWASPDALKNDPKGKLAQGVRERFDVDLAELGLKISDLPPPNADKWPGLKAVIAAMQGFPVTWK